MSPKLICLAALVLFASTSFADQTLTLSRSTCTAGTTLSCFWRNAAGCTWSVGVLKSSACVCEGTSCVKKTDPDTGCTTKDCCAASITMNDACTQEKSPTTTSVTTYIKPVCGLECRCTPAACF
jgi:hypothetical protein